MPKRKKSDQSDDKSASKDNTPKINRLGFFKLKPIASLLTSDEQFKYVIELGERVKHLLPVRSEIVMEAKNTKLEYENKIKAMKELSQNTSMNDKEKRSLINSMGMEAEDLMSDINEYEGMKKDISNDTRKF